jgi:hypothetical protein
LTGEGSSIKRNTNNKNNEKIHLSSILKSFAFLVKGLLENQMQNQKMNFLIEEIIKYFSYAVFQTIGKSLMKMFSCIK